MIERSGDRGLNWGSKRGGTWVTFFISPFLTLPKGTVERSLRVPRTFPEDFGWHNTLNVKNGLVELVATSLD